jgi:Phage tail tube protein
MDPTKTINGSFGTMHHDGQWLTNVTQAEAVVEINYEDINMAGTRWTGKKATSLAGTGTMTGYKITHTFTKLIARIADDSKGSFVTELIMKLDDPESAEGKTHIRLKGVQFDSIPLLSYEVNSIVTEETPFTFIGFEYI